VEELRRKDDIMLKNYQMAVMGEMIGVIAHQMKQPLSTIGLTVQDIEEAFIHGELDRAYLRDSVHTALEQIDFMALTIDDLKNYFNPNKSKREFSIGETIRKSLNLLSKQYLKYNITTTIDTEECFYHGVESELQQIILNITNNAKEALLINKTSNPRIAIRCKNDRESGETVIEIEDNAGGIPEAILDKIFDAYFTTKGDQGTGVGLYMVKKIVETFGGTIAAFNTPDGACFTIRLP
jgi:signal transduction histidine kinase